LSLALALIALAGAALLAHGGPVRGSTASHPLQGDLGASALPVGQVGGVSRVFVPRGDVLWAGLGPRVVAIDVRDVTAMRVIGRSTWLDGLVEGLDVDGGLAVATTDGGRLHVLDVADPAAPQPVGSVAAISGTLVATPTIAFGRGYAYVFWQTHDSRYDVTAANVPTVPT